MSNHQGRNTICVHAGTRRDESTGGVNTPVHASSSYAFPSPQGGDVCYPRLSNTPSQLAPAEKIAELEGAEAGLVFSSGMAAVTSSLLAFLKAGDHVVFQAGLYGGTHRFIASDLAGMGVAHSYFPGWDMEALEKAIRPNTRVIYLETPNNPLLKITDLEAAARIARGKGIVTITDNTFASPLNQNPISWGVDVALHSGSKYLNGHSDLICGAVATSRKLIKPIHSVLQNLGGSLNVMDCHLLERGMKTLGLRMERHNENALALARFLEHEPGVVKVHYPGLEQHPGHEVAKKQMKGFGGMLSFELDGDAEAANRLLSSFRLITPAVSLGGVESLACLPARTSHSSMPRDERLADGVTDGLVRLSVGIEDLADIQEDIARALKKALG